MFQRILVPLDGSKRAERAIPVAARIARVSGGSVVLLQVVAIPARYGLYMYESYLAQSPLFSQQLLDLETAKVGQYLDDISQSAMLSGIQTEREVLTGETELTILESVHTQRADLIVMCSRGDTGFKRWVLGSLSQKLARHSSVPVFVLHEGGPVPTSSFPDPSRPLRAFMGLVALDGSELAETALEPAAKLVAALSAPARGIFVLTRVVKLPGEDEQGSREHIDPYVKEEALSNAHMYLSAVANRLRNSSLASLKLAIVSSVAVGKDVASTLLKVAENGEDAEGSIAFGSCDLIAMATHGRDGLQRLTMGSVTERVLGATQRPVLVVHPQKQLILAEEKLSLKEKTGFVMSS